MKSYSFLKRALALLLVCGYAQATDAQDPKVRGIVYGENNEKLHNAIITLTKATHYVAISGEDGSFEVNSKSISRNDSLLLKVEYLGYFPVEMKVATNCEFDIHMEPNHIVPPDLIIGTNAIPRTLRTGYIFDDKGKPVAGAAIESKGDRKNKDYAVETKEDGYFEIRGSDFAELTIRAEGHKPLKLNLEALKKKQKESMHIKHDGLFIVIDFNW